MSKYSEMIDLTGKTVIVTGALSGAGKTIAEVFIESGAEVILTYRSSGHGAEEFRKQYPDRPLRFYPLDQSDPASIRSFVSALVNDLARDRGTDDPAIDCLVNNAGIYPAKPIAEIEPEDWDRMMDTNARGVFFLSKEIARFMKHGSIVNISSINATNPAKLLSHYGISKAAVEMTTRSMAQSFGPAVRVNCIAPGLIYKEGQDEFIPGWADSYRERSPLHRLVMAEDIGKTCLFLASDLSDAITGQVITVDCGILLAPAFFNE